MFSDLNKEEDDFELAKSGKIPSKMKGFLNAQNQPACIDEVSFHKGITPRQQSYIIQEEPEEEDKCSVLSKNSQWITEQYTETESDEDPLDSLELQPSHTL